jgi:hypothetical protein
MVLPRHKFNLGNPKSQTEHAACKCVLILRCVRVPW